jgi:hypothetical protein
MRRRYGHDRRATQPSAGKVASGSAVLRRRLGRAVVASDRHVVPAHPDERRPDAHVGHPNVEQTVKFHRARIMERMQARTVAELMHIAARLGIEALAAQPRGAREAEGREPKSSRT